jgi:Fur family ferric uptake transcriptional regulator
LQFEKALLAISVTDDERRYYELATDIHRHYAVCLKCKKMEYVNVCPVHDVSLDGFRITGHRLELYGYCNNCAEG